MIAAIVLAAGSSSRMGESKQLLDVHGEKLLARTVRTVREAEIKTIAVVLGSDEQAHRTILHDLNVDIVSNPDWQKGMGTSIKAGLRHLATKYPGLGAVFIFVCDQPLLNPEIISTILQKHRSTARPIVASGYAHVPGVPVLFEKRFFEQLLKLPDDQGAKRIIIQNLDDVEIVPFAGGEVDLDTMGDYRAFIEREQKY